MTPLVLSLALTSPAQPPVYAPPVPVFPAPQQPVVPVPRALTLTDFSRYFTPIPGKHEVWIVHPSTRRPVKVCFVLPGGKMEDFEVGDRTIYFEFKGGEEVEIEFRKNGTVKVEYDD